MPAENAPEPPWQRLDKYLFHTRLCRTRAIAAALISEGTIRINRQPTNKPGARVRIGDVLTVPLPRGVIVKEVVDLPSRRQSANGENPTQPGQVVKPVSGDNFGPDAKQGATNK